MTEADLPPPDIGWFTIPLPFGSRLYFTANDEIGWGSLARSLRGRVRSPAVQTPAEVRDHVNGMGLEHRRRARNRSPWLVGNWRQGQALPFREKGNPECSG
jgi:hypothetical protein